MNNKKVIIGSRGSDLALWQARFISKQLTDLGFEPTIEIIITKGDAIQHLSFDKLEGKGFFTKEIEEALLQNTIDLAVHSFKDLPTNNPPGLSIAAMSYREDPAELLLINPNAVDVSKRLQLKIGAVVGTSSARRKSQLLALRPDLQIIDLRGNVPTRIQKLANKQYDAIMLANAGVSRLNLDLSHFKAIRLDPKLFIPASAQGVLALQIRENDDRMQQIAKKLHYAEVAQTVEIERKALHLFEGGCQMPLAIYCEKAANNHFSLRVSYATNTSTLPVRFTLKAESANLLAENAVKKAKNIEPKSVFITRSASEASLFFRYLEAQNFKVNGQSLLSFSSINNQVPDADAFCFSSERAVAFALPFSGAFKDKLIFAIGEKTALALEAAGISVDFIGNGNPNETAFAFAPNMANKRIAFPQSKQSARTIQQHLPCNCHVIDWVIYDTNVVAKSLDHADITVVTSPSNFNGLLKSAYNLQQTKLVAIGPTTAKAISDAGFDCIESERADELFLVDAVFSL